MMGIHSLTEKDAMTTSTSNTNQTTRITATSTPVNPAIVVTPAAIDTGADTAGEFFPYNSATGLPEEILGFRTVVATYKQTAGMKAKKIAARSNVYVRVPTAHINAQTVTERMEELAPYIVQYLQGLEDVNVRGYHRDGCTKVFTETLSMDKILEELEEAGNTGLNGEIITEWYTEYLAPFLLVILATKLGSDNPEDLDLPSRVKVQAVIQSYLDTFVSLASGKTMLNAGQRERLLKAINLTGATETTLGIKFITRFKKMAKREEEALASLGDLEL